jgi:signal transduction histidine kinase
LGLFITRSIVELHDGRVWAVSELGVGSTFSIALPLTDSSGGS